VGQFKLCKSVWECGCVVFKNAFRAEINQNVYFLFLISAHQNNSKHKKIIKIVF
jgi:hypothetical protein